MHGCYLPVPIEPLTSTAVDVRYHKSNTLIGVAGNAQLRKDRESFVGIPTRYS
jgi:hypothetical protein